MDMNEIIRENLWWVAESARSYSHPPQVSHDELFTVGIEALLGCAERFNPKKSNFKTYAGHRVCGAFKDLIRDTTGGRAGRSGEPGKTLGGHLNFECLPRNVAAKNDSPLDKMIKDEWWETCFPFALSPKQRFVLMLRYRQRLTLIEIAELFNQSESRACQRVNRALRKLAKYPRQRTGFRCRVGRRD